MVAAKNAVARPMIATDSMRDRAHACRSGQERAHHVDAGGDHGGGVDQRGDRRGAGHGVRQPDVQRNLRGLAAGADQQQQADRGQRRASGLPAACGKTVAKSSEPKLHDDQEHRQRKAEIADAVHDERLVAGVGGELLVEVEADQQVAAQAHAFPADEQQQIVRAPAPASA